MDANERLHKLREQILAALRDLLLGFQSADRIAGGAILGEVRRGSFKELYTGLLTVLMRMVFVLYAEERGLLPMESDVYASSYSLSRLHAQLREDRDRYGDTIDDRVGAWGRVITLFRVLHDGVRAADGLFIPARKGSFFDPDAFPFLEGRPRQSVRRLGERSPDLPRVSDGVLLRVLDRLLLLDGERLHYKALDVEQIGSVYEGLMGFEVEVAEGDSLSLQPGEERRKSGSHYTPRALTQPIVEAALRPILERLGPEVRPEELLDLKVCDPAMGSGAFLVEACRQLADRLVDAWRRTGTMPDLPGDEDPVLHARRRIARRCIYGVDKNPLAVDLARLSLWLVTFAREHPFTFVDHSLRHGDSLVGLSKEQISSLGLDTSKATQIETVRAMVAEKVTEAESLRRQIHTLGDPPRNDELQDLWDRQNRALSTVRMLGDLVVAAYFAEDSDRARKAAMEDLRAKVSSWLATGAFDAELQGMVAALRQGEKPVPALHWEIEFPEVFTPKTRGRGGFDCFVGNPPFAGKNTIVASNHDAYLDWLLTLHVGANGNSDLVAHFFRRAFDLLRDGGTMGFIATNTIAQGDTRATGLRHICESGGAIYQARRRYKWPGVAAVVVSIVHIKNGPVDRSTLDGSPVPKITAYLFHGGSHKAPARLRCNADRAYLGSNVLGKGFFFEDGDAAATPLRQMMWLVQKDPANKERVYPFLGGEEVNDSPTHAHHRHIINFGEMSEVEARRWPDLIEIIERKVKPYRERQKDERAKKKWWQFVRPRAELYEAIRTHERVLVCSQTSKYRTVTFVSNGTIFGTKLVVFVPRSFSFFAMLQSRIHEAWALFFGSSMKDDPVYTPSICFEAFPFPPEILREFALLELPSPSPAPLEAIGETYSTHRAALMIQNNEGLTKTYNRFHDPEDRTPLILRLRDLHAAMDRAVLDAYGWTDIIPVYDFHRQLDESIRLTWAEDTRFEVLARLLELNRVMVRFEQEGGKTGRRDQ